MKPALKKEDLDWAGSLFGFTFNPEYGSPPGCFTLYIEDDENWNYVTSFNQFWIPDLEKALLEMKKLDKGGKP